MLLDENSNVLETVDIVALFGPFGRPNRNRKGDVARFEAVHTSVNYVIVIPWVVRLYVLSNVQVDKHGITI